MISGCIVWFWLDASLLSSGYDHRWYRATQQAIYVASVEEMAYIGGTCTTTAIWTVMMKTIQISNVQEKSMWRNLFRFFRWVMTTSEQNGNIMLWIPAHYKGKQSSKSRSISTPDDWCHLISQNHIMPALFDHDFGGSNERGCTWCLSIWSPASVSTWTTKVYTDISVPLLLCPISFSWVVRQAEHTWCTQYWSTR